MSNVSGTAGWWLASDGRWYPPEQSPWRATSLQPTGSTGWAVAGVARPTASAGARRATARIWVRKLDAQVKSLLAITLVLIIAAVVIPIVGGSEGSLVTPQVEGHVIATTWQTFSTALSQENLGGLRATTTPGALASIAGWLGCGCAPWPSTTTQVLYSAPPQSRYPIYFFAEIESVSGTGGAPLQKEVVFRDAGPTRPWLIAYVGAFNGGSLFANELGLLPGSPYLQTPPQQVPVDMSTIPQEFSAFFQAVDQTGTAPPLPPRFEQTPLLAQDITGSEQAVQSNRASHLSDQFSHRVLQVSPVFALPYGDFECMELGLGDYITPTSGSRIVQPSNRSQWGVLLAPGSYTSLGEVSVYDACFYELTGGSIMQVTNLGGMVDIVPNVAQSDSGRIGLS